MRAYFNEPVLSARPGESINSLVGPSFPTKPLLRPSDFPLSNMPTCVFWPNPSRASSRASLPFGQTWLDSCIHLAQCETLFQTPVDQRVDDKTVNRQGYKADTAAAIHSDLPHRYRLCAVLEFASTPNYIQCANIYKTITIENPEAAL